MKHTPLLAIIITMHKFRISISLFWYRYQGLIILTIVVCLFPILFNLSDNFQYSNRIKNQNKLAETTVGHISNIKILDSYGQGLSGAKEINHGYVIEYIYQVRKTKYKASNIIKDLESIRYNKDKSITIKYSSLTPQKSLIKLIE